MEHLNFANMPILSCFAFLDLVLYWSNNKVDLIRKADVNYFTRLLLRFTGQMVETRGVLLKKSCEQEVFSFIWAWVSERSDLKVVGQRYTQFIITDASHCTMHSQHPYLHLPGPGHCRLSSPARWFISWDANRNNNRAVIKITADFTRTMLTFRQWFPVFQVQTNDCETGVGHIWRYTLN